jgi:hypothetical protein
MSISFLSHKEIDPEKWNDLLLRTPNARLFSHYAYLNVVNPDWSALIEQEGEKYISAFPLTFKKKFGLKYIVQPFMTQQLQILNRNSGISEDFRKQLNKILSKYVSVRLSLNNTSADKLSGFKCTERKTMVLSLQNGKDYYDSFAKKHQQSIRISRKFNFKIEKSRDFQMIIEGFLKNKAGDIGLSHEGKITLHNLIPFFEAQKSIRVHAARDLKGNIRAAGLFAGFGDTMTFLLSFSDDTGKKNCLMHAIILDWLENDSENYHELDFEGGNIKSLERFYGRFGAEPKTFSFCERHSFPFGLYFKRR